ncbi:MAG: protein kinase [Terriglobia bacterium]
MKTCPTCQVSYPNNYAICPADGSPLAVVGVWSDGNIIRGKYRVLGKVGQGGMGSVYKALHLAFDELRALKVIAPELLADELFVKRFKHEAVITRRLQHPNAVRVDDIDEAEDGRPYIVMEFIDGKSLKKLIREEGALPVQRVLSIIKQCAAALDAAHRLGMVHRDIKPDNIALVDSPDGETVKVLDFGIAKAKEARMGEAADLTLTGAGVVVGTPQYMPPEQAMGKRGDELDGRADLYSLGVVMYQMLTADLPFKADTTMEMLLAHVNKPPAPIGVLHPELQIPEDVAALAMRLLEKNRDLRPASARVLIQEIEKLEKDLANPGQTQVLTSDDMVRAGQNPGQTGSGRGAAGGVVPPRPQPLPVRPAGPPKPVPPPVVRPQPPVQVVAAPLPRPHPPESRWGIWAALIVLLVGVGGGGLYIATRQPSSVPPGPTGTLTATLSVEPDTVEKGQSVTLRWSAQNATGLDLEPGVGQVQPEGTTSVTPQDSITYTLTATGPGGTQMSEAHVSVTSPIGQNQTTGLTTDTRQQERKTKATRKTEPPPPPPPPPPVKGNITLGDFLFKRGDYDKAIAAYEEGLQKDSSNAELRQKLEQAIRVCKTERATLGEPFKCGGN